MSNIKTTFSTDREVKSFRPRDKDYAVTDIRTVGLQLRIKTNGKKQWIFRYSSPTIKGKDGKGRRSSLGLGLYPEKTLENVRAEVARLRKKIQDGIDPSEEKKPQY